MLIFSLTSNTVAQDIGALTVAHPQVQIGGDAVPPFRKSKDIFCCYFCHIRMSTGYKFAPHLPHTLAQKSVVILAHLCRISENYSDNFRRLIALFLLILM